MNLLTVEIGSVHGHWTVLSKPEIKIDVFPSGKHSFQYVLARCKCGTIKQVRLYRLLKGETSACTSCANGENNKKHGMYKSPEYTAYVSMIQRCYNENSCNYSNYGFRGITVAKRWLGKNGFKRFFADMGLRPVGFTKKGKSLFSIERKDNNKGYSKDNCIWADITAQNNNRRPYTRKKAA